MDDEFEGFEDGDGSDDALGDEGRLPPGESWLVTQDLDDLDAFEEVFAPEGVKGVSMWCHDCDEEHFYRWDLLRSSLQLLLETGEIPVHEPAYAPDPDEYVPWEYAHGYVDALRDVGVDQRADAEACPRCALPLAGPLASGNWCPRCGAPLLEARLREALAAAGLDEEATASVLRATGIPAR